MPQNDPTLIDALVAAHWSGDPRQLRKAIRAALDSGMKAKQVAEELRTTKARVLAAVASAY